MEDLSESSFSTPSELPSAGRLDSWKEIAAYLRREVRTVQRWEKEEGLPVHRSPHKRQGRIYAYTAELDIWWKEDHARLAELDEAERSVVPTVAESEQTRAAYYSRAETSLHLPRRLLFALLAGLTIALAATLTWIITRPRPSALPAVSSVHTLTSDSYWKDSFAADGDRIYYTEHVGGRTLLDSTAPDEMAGWPDAIPLSMTHPKILGISPQGGRLLLIDSRFGEPEPLMTLSLPSAAPLAVQRAVASCAAWSPDAKWIAYCRGNSVFRLREGREPERLASFAGEADSLAWSPDGRLIRVVVVSAPPSATPRPAQARLSLWQLGPPGTAPRALALPPDVGDACSVSTTWTGNGNDFLLAYRCDYASGIYLLPHRNALPSRASDWIPLATGFSRIRQLASLPASNKLLLLEVQSGPLQLMRFDPNTEKWTPFQLGTNAVELNYSKDGRWITYVEYPQRTLWRVRADGADRLQLTFPPLKTQLPRWSPDGKTIAFSGATPGARWKVYLVSALGGPARPADSAGTDEGAPTWSPNGRAVVFGDVETADASSHLIHLLDLRTKQLTNLPGSSALRTARWSPDGRYIAAVRYEAHELVLFDVAGRNWTTVAGGVNTEVLNWSPDSRYIYFDCRYEPYPGIYRYDLKGRTVEPVVRFGSFREGPDLNSDVGGFSLAPDGSILVNASLQSSHIYSVTLKR